MEAEIKPVYIYIEVRREGSPDVLMKLGCVAGGGPAMWDSPTLEADIITPNGPVSYIVCSSAVRGRDTVFEWPCELSFWGRVKRAWDDLRGKP